MKKGAFILFALLCIFVYQCERRFPGLGEDGEIRVLADSSVWLATEPILKEIFEIPLLTPQNETMFTILRGNLNTFKKFKNLIFISTMEDSGIVADMVKRNLSQEARNRVEEGSYLFIKKSEWASDQLIMFLVSTNIDSLKKRLVANKDYLFRILDEHWNENQKNHIYKFHEQIELQKYLLQNYGWTIRVPHDYEVFIQKPDSGFIMIRRTLPERWLFVYWLKTDDPSLINKEWCLARRDEIGVTYYDGDKIENVYTEPEVNVVDFLGKYAIKITGLWRNDEKEAGGPFRNYCFYDEPSQRIFMIDYAIFAPRLKRSKRDLLRQAEIIMNTFRTSSEISVEDLKSTD